MGWICLYWVTLSRSFGVNSVPFLVVIDPSGRIVLAENDGLTEGLSNLSK